MAKIDNSSFRQLPEVPAIVERIREWATRLSSGLRINTAADEPTGTGIVEQLRADMVEMRQGSNNLSNGLSLVQTADASAGQIQSNLVRMRELSAQASSGTYSDEQKQILQYEFKQLSEENSRIANDTQFNGMQIHSEKTTEVQFGQGQSIEVKTQAITTVGGDLVKESVSVSEKLQTAIDEISDYRGALGATSSRIEEASEGVNAQIEKISQSESRISDTDMAQAIASKTAQDIILQSAIAVQVHADSFSEVILNLLGPKQHSFSA